MHGIGSSPLGPVEGTTVVGFFTDIYEQVPIILGTLSGIPFRKPVKKFGFRDPATTLANRPNPSEDFPRQELLKEPDVNRLARRQKVSKTIVQSKKDARDLGVPIAFSGKWDQPQIPYNPDYPYNHVTESESGHVFETDDTKGNERLHSYHRKGTFTEIDANGTRVNRIVGDDFEIIERNSYVHIKGKSTITVDGQCDILVKADCNLQVDGNLKAHAHGNMEFKAGKKITMSAGDGFDMHANKNFTINSLASMMVRSLRGLTMTGTIKTTISSPITEVALLKMNGMMISPLPPKPPIFMAPSTIGSKSPNAKNFPTLKLPSLKPDVAVVIVLPITEATPMT
jgi:hypothetical protein